MSFFDVAETISAELACEVFPVIPGGGVSI
jgi:hypothetical protein